jgi:PAS domain S-box-containing protein
MAAEPTHSAAVARSADAQARRSGRRLAGVFLLLAGTLTLGGYFYLSDRQAEARAEAHRELRAIADLKLGQIKHWREERLSDARFFSRARFVAQDVQRFLKDPNSEAARAAVLHWMDLLKGGERYAAVIVYDAHYERRLAVPEGASDTLTPTPELLEQAVRERRVVFGPLHRHATNAAVYMDIAFPVFENADFQAGAPLAAVQLELDARQFLFPLIQSWPTPSKTAETLLIRREGNEVVFLNDLRYRPGAALRLRLPLASPALPGAKVLRGHTGVMEGTDYRGVPVVAAGRLVPGTDWAMVAKIDRAEVYAPLRQQTFAALTVLGALLLAAAALVALLWRQQSAQFLECELAERKVHEQAMERMNRLYAALSQVNQAVVRSGSRDELMRQICQALVKFGGFQMAWLGWVDPNTRRVVPVAQHGDNGYLQRIEVYSDDRPEGHGPVGIAIREGRPCVCNDFLADPRMGPWRDAGAEAGWHSLAAFPIREENSIRGALVVYANQTSFFGAQERALLEEAASDVSFGLDTLLNQERRQRAEDQLRLAAAALESAANAIVITNRQGTIEWVNAAFERLTGYGTAEALGQTPRLLRSDRQPPDFFKGMWQTILAGQVWHGELVNKRKDGSFYDEEMTVTPVRNARGETTHFVAIKQDISGRKQAEEALRQARDALARANAELEQKVARRTAELAEANSNLTNFAHSAAHDLRAPLRSIRNFSGMVLDECGAGIGEDGRSMLQRVMTAGEQMAALLEDLLDYSRISQADLNLQPVSLQAAVGETLKLLDADIRAKSAVVTAAGPLPEVDGHSATILLLINNLVSNALKFMAPGVQPQVRLWAERRDNYIRLWVQDNGIGIAPEFLEKIFAPFQRLHGKGAYPGTGLGLAIVRKAAERMGGRAGVESEPGKGSRFWLELKAA